MSFNSGKFSIGKDTLDFKDIKMKKGCATTDKNEVNDVSKFSANKPTLMLNSIKSMKEYEYKIQIMKNRLARLKRVEKESQNKLNNLKEKIEKSIESK